MATVFSTLTVWSEMESVTRYLNVAYLLLGVVLAWFFVKTLDMLLGWAGPGADRILFMDVQLSLALGVVLGVGIAFFLYRNDKVFTWSNEVAVELSKVTWPDREDTMRSTYVVVIFSFIISAILAAFDFVWKYTTDWLL
jgi:preprotein translocase subunit SecE